MNPPTASFRAPEERSVLPARRDPIGAEVHPQGVHFRVWAPRAAEVGVKLSDRRELVRLTRGEDGYFSGWAEGARSGSLYRFLLDGRGPFPDPASRFQPEGPHGSSEVVDPAGFEWTDGAWPGLRAQGQVLYELHVGTFTPEGTWNAAALHLPRLKDLGITALEIMPVADFPGRFGWGYDGVSLFAPSRLYGRPDDFRRFVDRAHALSLGVLLDVVYNHFGPDGNYLPEYSADYLTDRYPGEWGTPINFDGPGSGPVREFFGTNAACWIRDYHLDGLRFDATQAMFDSSADPILSVIGRRVRDVAAPRQVYLIGENEPQDSALVRPRTQGGMGLDALVNDDFHHSARVALTGFREAYFSDYQGAPQEFISALRWGYLYQGQYSSWQKQTRGKPAVDLPSWAFINFLENHDQVANSGTGRRLWQLSSPGRHRALTALLLLGPGTPLLFQGQEYASSKPFLYFADHAPPLDAAVARGRRQFLSQFPSLRDPQAGGSLPDPADPRSFQSSVLDPAEIERHPESIRLHRDLLGLRKADPVLAAQRRDLLEGTVLGAEAFLLRWRGPGSERLLLINLGPGFLAEHCPDPMLAPPMGTTWELAWSSDSEAYGGGGIFPPYRDGCLFLPAASAIFLRPGIPAP